MNKSPFISLLKTINAKYFYDVNKNQIISVDSQTWNILKRVIERRDNILEYNLEDKEYILIRELLERGYLSNHRVQYIEHPMNNDIETVLERRIQKVTLQLTQNCNFRCTYCNYTSNDGSQRMHSNKRMSMDMAKKAILFLKEHSIDSNEVNIGFYGGEPLLEFEMMKEVVQYAEKVLLGKKIIFTVTTNGVLINDDIINFFIQHKFDIVISLDGPKEINDLNRVLAGSGQGTFDEIIEKIDYIRQKYPEFYKKITINMVMNPEHDFETIHKLFKEHPYLRKLNNMSTVVDDITTIKKNKYSEEYRMKSTYQEFLAYLSVMNRIPASKLYPSTISKVTSIQELDKYFKTRERIPERIAPGGPCNPGEVRLMVTIEGNFIVCERVNEISDCMIIGNIESGFNLNKVRALLNVAEITKENCFDCWAFSGCNLCAKYADEHGKLSKEFRLQHCERSKNNFYLILQEKILLNEAKDIYNQSSI